MRPEPIGNPVEAKKKWQDYLLMSKNCIKNGSYFDFNQPTWGTSYEEDLYANWIHYKSFKDDVKGTEFNELGLDKLIIDAVKKMEAELRGREYFKFGSLGAWLAHLKNHHAIESREKYQQLERDKVGARTRKYKGVKLQ